MDSRRWPAPVRTDARRSAALAAALLLLYVAPTRGAGREPSVEPAHDPLLGMGFVTPLLIGYSHGTPPLPIDLRADGTTDLLVLDTAVLNGRELLPGRDIPSINVLAQGDDGTFALAQTLHVPRMRAFGPSVGDLDGDGLDDLVVLTEIGLVPLLQRPSGRFEPGHESPRAGSYPSIVQVSSTGGRVLLAGDDDDGAIRFDVYQHTQLGTLELSHSLVDTLPWQNSPRVATAGDRFLVLRCSYESGDGRISGFVLGDSLEIPESPILERDYGWAYPMERRNGGGRASDIWVWDAADERGFQRVALADDGRIRLTREDAEPWLPPGCRPYGLPRSVPGRQAIYHAIEVNDPYQGASILLREDASGRSLLSHFRQNDVMAPIVRADGGVSVLLQRESVCMVAPPEGAAAPPYEEGAPDDEPIDTGDWNADGLPDLLAWDRSDRHGVIQWRPGVASTPYFGPPIPIAATSAYYTWRYGGYMGSEDLDGDAWKDVAFSEVDDNGLLVPLFWDGWTFRAHPGSAINPADAGLPCSDLDGDGRAETVLATGDEWSLAEWTQDRTLADLVPIDWGVIGQTGMEGILPDVDGDGRDEIFIEASFTRYTYGLYRMEDGDPKWFRQTRYWTMQERIFGYSAADIDRDGVPDLIALTGRSIVGLSFRSGVREIFRIERFPNCETFIGAADFDQDGTIDLLMGDGASLALVRDPAGRSESNSYALPWTSDLYRVRVVDLEGDGDPDIIVQGSKLRYFVNRAADPRARGPDATSGPRIRLLTGQPVRGAIRCAILPHAEGPLRVTLHDVTGRTLFAESRTIGTPSPFAFRLDPEAVLEGAPAGVYFLRASGAGGAGTARIVWLP